jgi:hypothetical protein
MNVRVFTKWTYCLRFIHFNYKLNMQEANPVNLQGKLFQRIHHPWLDSPLDLDLPSFEPKQPTIQTLLERE